MLNFALLKYISIQPLSVSPSFKLLKFVLLNLNPGFVIANDVSLLSLERSETRELCNLI